MSTERKRIFLDASVLIAASRSESGASSLMLEVCRGKLYQAVVSLEVLWEARRNIGEKFGETELIRFYRLLASVNAFLSRTPTSDELRRCTGLVPQKDVHVLASALASRVSVLVTLDRHHFMTTKVAGAGLPFAVLTPGEFLRRLR